MILVFDWLFCSLDSLKHIFVSLCLLLTCKLMWSCLMSKPVSFLTWVEISANLYSLFAFHVYPLHDKSQAGFREFATIFILNFLMLYIKLIVWCICVHTCACGCVLCICFYKRIFMAKHIMLCLTINLCHKSWKTKVWLCESSRVYLLVY